MKRFLLTATLILALVTSMTAGTMAFYSKTVDTITSDIKTKTFSLTADKTSADFKKDLKIAPGDTITYKVVLTNASEVSTKVTFNAKLSKAYDGMFVTVVASGSGSFNATSMATSDDSDEVVVTMDPQSTQEFVVTVAWDYQTGKTEDAGQKTTLSIGMSGIQVNDNAQISA